MVCAGLCERNNDPVPMNQLANDMLKQQKVRGVTLAGKNDKCMDPELLAQISTVMVRVTVGDSAWNLCIKCVRRTWALSEQIRVEARVLKQSFLRFCFFLFS